MYKNMSIGLAEWYFKRGMAVVCNGDGKFALFIEDEE